MQSHSESGRWMRPKEVVARYPLGLTALRDLGRKHPGLYRKVAHRLAIVDRQMLDEILANSPPIAPTKN